MEEVPFIKPKNDGMVVRKDYPHEEGKKPKTKNKTPKPKKSKKKERTRTEIERRTKIQ